MRLQIGRSWIFFLCVFGVVGSTSAQVRYKVYDSGADFNPTRIGHGGRMAGQQNGSYAYDRYSGLMAIPPFPNMDQIWAEDVNRGGVVVGAGLRQIGGYTAFRWDITNGTRMLADFNGRQSEAFGLNDYGEIVGRYEPEGSMSAFFWRPDGTWITLPPKYGGWCGAYKINNYRDILGYSQIDAFNSTIVIWRPDGSIVDLGNYPGQDQNFAFDLNNRGFVCGAATGNLGTFGYIWAPNGAYTGIFNPYGSGYLDTTGLNDTGYAIGSLIHPTLGWKGYIRYPNGTIKLLNDLLDASSQGWDVREAWDINNTGQISAAGYKNGQRRGLLLHPVLGPPVFSPTSPR